MIPKIIHYCWFGGNSLTPLGVECMASWRKYCPDYEIREWNESNFDINCNNFVREAYRAKKYAFVSDYVRLLQLYNYGGIYMDTDVEVLKPLDDLLNQKAFAGFEALDRVSGGILAGMERHPFFEHLISYYNGRSFIKSDGSYDITTNVTIITNYFVQKGLKLDNTFQTVEGLAIYPQEYFSPKEFGKSNVTLDTYTIHHFAGSWLSPWAKWKIGIHEVLGPKLTLTNLKGKLNFNFLKRK